MRGSSCPSRIAMQSGRNTFRECQPSKQPDKTRLKTCEKNRNVRCVGCTLAADFLPVVKRAAGQILSDRRTHLRQNNQNSLEVQNRQNFLADQGPCQAIQM